MALKAYHLERNTSSVPAPEGLVLPSMRRSLLYDACKLSIFLFTSLTFLLISLAISDQ